ncbi:MAG: zinc-ribbon domain-containing protein [Methanoregula sp.]|nr:zinc-ribbon domain-containing protein [Methanoregula sp.]
MQCPDCGYEVDDTAVFCPHCRFQFRDTDDRPVVPGTPVDTPVHDVRIDESIFEQTPQTFSDRELKQLEVQLLAPAVLIVLIISLFTYTVISTVPFIPITLAGLNFGVIGIICLVCGLVAGMVFFILARRSLRKFRYR